MDTDNLNMPERIHQIMEFSKMSQQDFAAKLGISAASLSSIFNGRTRPTNNHTVAIHKAFPDISLNWLLFGEGEMREAESEGQSASFQTEPSVPANDLFAGASQGANVSSYSTASGMQRKDYGYRVEPSMEVKNIDIKKRLIKEIRVFFDDGTYESFVPQKN